jgi:hypothetical protein
LPWTTTTIAGHPADLFEPSEPHPVCALLHLCGHDGTTPADSDDWTAALERHGLRCVVPRVGETWWLNRPDTVFDASLPPLAFLRTRVVPWIAERWEVRPPLVGLTGFGVGGQGALQLAYRHAREFPVVAAISPEVDVQFHHGEGTTLDELYPNPEAVRQETAILHVHPLDWPRHQLLLCDPADPWLESHERLTGKLYSSGIPFESETAITTRDPDGAHGEPYVEAVAAKVLAFVAERLDKESRRSTSTR